MVKMNVVRRIRSSIRDWQYGLSRLLFEDACTLYTDPVSYKIECGCNRPDDYGSRESEENKGEMGSRV